MKSMTGYGFARSSFKNGLVEVSIRSVNGRYLEPRFHLPKEYFFLETSLKKNLEKFFERGTVDIYITKRSKGDSARELIFNRSLALQYKKGFEALASTVKLKSGLSLETLAHMPEIFQVSETWAVSAQEKATILSVFNKACGICESTRLREGTGLRKVLSEHLRLLQKEVAVMTASRAAANVILKEKFEHKIKTRLQNLEIDMSRLMQEVALQLEKSDIDEELVRLQEHIRTCQQILRKNGPQGKKLEFYTQELLREVNTIGSKSNVSQLTRSVVEAKTVVERIREQIQNIE